MPQTTQSEIDSRVTSSLSGVPLDGPPSISVSPSTARPCQNRTGETVTVTVQAVTSLDIPLWETVSKTLTGKGEFRCE